MGHEFFEGIYPREYTSVSGQNTVWVIKDKFAHRQVGVLGGYMKA